MVKYDSARERKSAPTPDDFVWIGKEVQNKSGAVYVWQYQRIGPSVIFLAQVLSLCAFFGLSLSEVWYQFAFGIFFNRNK